MFYAKLHILYLNNVNVHINKKSGHGFFSLNRRCNFANTFYN